LLAVLLHAGSLSSFQGPARLIDIDVGSGTAVEKMILDRDPMDELRRAFRLFDEDNTGKISLRNLKKVARELGENLGDDELYVFLARARSSSGWAPRPWTRLDSLFQRATAADLVLRRLRRQAMIDEFDLDQDNEISEQEFIA
jgi:centrin-3